MKKDLEIWHYFLQHYNGTTVIFDENWASADSIELYTDNAGRKTVVLHGVFYWGKWAQDNWPAEWSGNGTIKDILFLLLFLVVVAFYIWGDYLKNKKLIFHIDNQYVVHIINTITLKVS